MKRFLFSFLPVLFHVACHTSHFSSELDRVASYISEYPDSALTVLETFTPDSFHTNGEKARYALLLSMAMDKNYIDICSDSLIRPAIDYYASGKDRHSRFLTCYYQGRIYENAGQRRKAIETYTLAERDTAYAMPVEKVRLYTARYRLYLQDFALGKMEEDIGKASVAAGKVSNPAYMYRIRLDQAGLHLMRGCQIEAKEELIRLNSWLETVDMQPTSDYYALLLRTDLESGQNPSSSDIDTYNSACERESVSPDPLLTAECRLMSKDDKGALRILQGMKEKDFPDPYQKARFAMLLYRTRRENGNVAAALDAKNRYDEILEGINMEVFNHETQFIEERFRSREELQKKQTAMRRMAIWSGAIILMISAVAAFFIRSRIRLRRDLREMGLEYAALTRILSSYGDTETPALPVIRKRIAALKPYLSNPSDRPTDKALSRMKEDRRTMLESVGLMYALSMPGFVQYLAGKELTPAEIGLCAFYLSDYSTKEMPDIIGQKSIYQINARIRSKLGLNVHDTTLPLYLKGLFVSEKEQSGTS